MTEGGRTDAPPGVGIEIASVEHPRLLRAVLDEAQRRGVPLKRVSQGSGTHMLTESELAEMLGLAREAGVEFYSFISSRNSFEQLVDAQGADQLRGEHAFADAVDELHRCVAAGVSGVLVPDIGLLATAGELRRSGRLGDLGLKSAAAIAPRNAAAAAVLERLGATSINTASSSTLEDLKAMRAALAPQTTLDVYIESPDDFGGGMRYREVAEMAASLAPLHLKFGLRNAPALYPYGGHLEPMAEQTMREKVRRAELALGRLTRR